MVDDRYRIEERIGAGGMGDVYRARQLNVDRPIAIKLLKPERVGDARAVKQFLTEAQAVSRLTSPHTVTLLDVGTLPEGAPFMVMELLEGSTLRSRQAEGALTLDEAVDVVDAIALSLSEAHARGVIHRDLKPSNVFLARTPGHRAQVKVLDFGLAALAGDQAGLKAAGTPRYMAPEALSGGDITARTDVYALAMVAYELIAGAHPFAEHDGDAVIDAQLSEVPQPLGEVAEDVPSAAAKLIARSLAKPPRLRPRDAAAFRRKWREAFGLPEDTADRLSAAPVSTSGEPTLPSQTVVSRTIEEVAPTEDAPLRRGTAWAAAAVVVVALGFGWAQLGPSGGAEGVSSSPSSAAPPADAAPERAVSPSTSNPAAVAPSAEPRPEPSVARPVTHPSAAASTSKPAPLPRVAAPRPRPKAPQPAKPAPSVPFVPDRIDDYLGD